MTDGRSLTHTDDRIGASGMQPKELFRRAKAANWLLIRRNRLKGDRRSQGDCTSDGFGAGIINWEGPHGKSRLGSLSF